MKQPPKSLKGILREKLPPEQLKLVYRSYDVIGDIAIIRVPEAIGECSGLIAEAVMQIHKNVRSVWRQTGPIAGDFRLRRLEWVAGEKRTETIHREHGCSFKVDIKKCYFSPRLSHERMRITRQVKPGETVVNMFAGVGCYSILIAKKSPAVRVYSIDINPHAVRYMRENVRANKVNGKVVPILGDAKRTVKERLRGVADRVLMPLPEKAYEYLDAALLALKPKGGLIHYYDFEHARKGEDPVAKVEEKVSLKLEASKASYEFLLGRKVRTTGPNWYQIVLDVRAKLNW